MITRCSSRSRIALPPLKERFDRFDEGVEAIIALLSQTVTDYDGQHARLASARCEPKEVLREHCAAVGRDFSEVTCSCQVRAEGDLDALLTTVAGWRDAGADLAVIGLPLHAKPELVGELSAALAPLA